MDVIKTLNCSIPSYPSPFLHWPIGTSTAPRMALVPRSSEFAAQTRRRAVVHGCTTARLLQRAVKILDQDTGQEAAAYCAFFVGACFYKELPFFGECKEIRAEHIVQRFIPAHIRNGGCNFSVFHPETCEASHSRYAGSRRIAPVKVVEVRNVDAGSQFFECIRFGERPRPDSCGTKSFI